MKKTGQQTRFRDDLRRLLLFYALLPVLAAVLLLIVSLGYIPLQNVVRGTADDLQLAWDAFGQQWRDMEGELIALQNELDLSAFRSSVNYQAAFKSRIYQFINQSEIRPQFFLLDADESLIFSTQVNQGMRESLQNSFHWRLANNLPAAGGEVATAVTRADVGVATVSSVLLGCRLFDEAGGGAGYVYFAVGEDQMAAPFKQCTSDLIVTDRFDSVFLGTDSAFVGDFGKLRARLRDANGFTVLSEGLFYIRTLHAFAAGCGGAGVLHRAHGAHPGEHRPCGRSEDPHHRRNRRGLPPGAAGRSDHGVEHQQPRRISDHFPGVQQHAQKHARADPPQRGPGA